MIGYSQHNGENRKKYERLFGVFLCQGEKSNAFFKVIKYALVASVAIEGLRTEAVQ